MKKIICCALLFAGMAAQAQNKRTVTDTTVHFIVKGNCQMCKDRIEEAAHGRGVIEVSWDIDTKDLSLRYNPAQTTIDKVEQRIADVGHDTPHRKADDGVYKKLPDCCLYRDGTMEALAELKKQTSTEIGAPAEKPGTVVKGVVLESDEKGNFHPLAGASVRWLGTTSGMMTDSNGVFTIPVHDNIHLLVFSFTGYKADTISVSPAEEIKVVLASGHSLQEVKVSAVRRSSYLSPLSPLMTTVMSERELFKAACCNLSESFETNPSVDVAYNDAVTGSRQIQLLGLAGVYSQLTLESLPGPRGLAAAYGINYIPGPWIESIQLTRGTGSVVNGYESIAGQINVEMKKPESAERFYLNGYINSMGKTDLNLVLSQKLGKKWSTALLLHDDFLQNKTADMNHDGFRDLPTGNQFSVFNRWKYDNANGLLFQAGFKYMKEDRTGGETAFDPSVDKFSMNHYGLGIQTTRTEAFSKLGYVFPQKKYKSIGLQLSGFRHDQHAYYGMMIYNALQDNFYANLIYQSIIGTTKHKFRTGLSMNADKFRELYRSVRFDRNETTPGVFFEYTFSPDDKFSAVAGLRADHNSIYGTFITPRLHIRYAPVKGTTFRFSGGRGQRTANILADNAGLLASSRIIMIMGGQSGKAYGLDQEVAWNEGVSLEQKFRLFNRSASLVMDFFRTDFTKQVVTDLEDPSFFMFYNLNGKSFSNSFQAELEMEPVHKLEVRLAYRLFDVKSTYNQVLMSRPLVSRNRAFMNLAYDLKGWKFDYTINVNGKKRLPPTVINPTAYHRDNESPAFVQMNAQLSKTVGKKHPVDLYIGGENLTNFMQENAIVAADHPFGPYFDASMVWGPVTGRQLYAGFRYKIK